MRGAPALSLSSPSMAVSIGLPTRLARSAGAALREVPIYPPIVAAAFVIGLTSVTYVPLDWLVRPLLVAVIGTSLLQVTLSVLVRDRQLAAAAALSILLAIATVPVALAAAPTAVAIALWLLEQRLASQRLFTLSRLNAPLNTLALAWLAVSIGWSVPFLIPPSMAIRSPVALGEQPAVRPDVYVILLDGYPRSDTLASWGFDNRPFLAALAARGLYVSPDSASDYTTTIYTIPSIMQMNRLEDLPVAVPSEAPARDRTIWALTNDSPAVAQFRAMGYETYSTVSHSAPAALRSVDHYLDHGYVNEFEGHLLQVATQLDVVLSWLAPEWLPDQYRQRVLANFEDLRAIAGEPGDKPRFVWGQVMNPHPPLVIHSDGSLAAPVDCFPNTCTLQAADAGTVPRAEFIRRYTDQVTFDNNQVLRTIDAILANEARQSIIVVLSDHGSRYDPADPAEWYRSFFAARTPGYDRAFGDAPRPRMLFPVLFKTYFGITPAD